MSGPLASFSDCDAADVWFLFACSERRGISSVEIEMRMARFSMAAEFFCTAGRKNCERESILLIALFDWQERTRLNESYSYL